MEAWEGQGGAVMDGNFRQGRPKFSQGIIPGQPGEKKSQGCLWEELPTSQQQSRDSSGSSEEAHEAGSESVIVRGGARLWGSWEAEKRVCMTRLTPLCSPSVLAQAERCAMNA